MFTITDAERHGLNCGCAGLTSLLHMSKASSKSIYEIYRLIPYMRSTAEHFSKGYILHLFDPLV